MLPLNKLKGIIKNWWVTVAFFTFYIIINAAIIKFNGGKYPSSNIATFLTSWFNPMEDANYGKPYIGFLLNFGMVLFIIIIAEKYSSITYKKLGKYAISIGPVFLFSISATYVISTFNWFEYGFAGSGTSIVAFCMMITFGIIGCHDLLNECLVRKFKDYDLIEIFLELCLIFFLFVAPLAYVIGTPTPIVLNHIEGLGVYAPLVVIYMIHRNYLNRRKLYQKVV